MAGVFSILHRGVCYVFELSTFRVSRVGERVVHARMTQSCRAAGKKEETQMLWTIAVVLIVLWALGLVTSYTLGGFVHVLLVIAIVVVVIQVIQGRRRL